jgi:tRNA threonylcarbamoyladenosine biosynthesis protein TsaB
VDTGGEDISGGSGQYNIGILIILALDTTTAAGSTAIVRDGFVLAEQIGNAEITHGQRLPAELAHVLDLASVRIEDVEVIAVAAGPGSFTGLRVGIATAQGLAMARSLLVVPVSALEALARAAVNPERPIAAWMDAHRGQVFSEVYAADGLEVLVPAESSLPTDILDTWDSRLPVTPVFVGDGAVRYRAEIRARFGETVGIIEPPPLAGIVGLIAATRPDRAVLPHAVVPIYVRKPDAELARIRRLASG